MKQQNYAEGLGGVLWESTPQIEGLSPEESEQVYNGNFGNVLDRIKSIPDPEERDRLILEVSGNVTFRQKELYGVKETAETEWKQPEKVEEYQKSLDALDRFNTDLLSLHQAD